MWGFPVAVVAAVLPIVSGIGVSFDTRVFLSEENPHYQDLKRFEATFRRTSQIFFLLKHETFRVDQPEFASVIEELTEAAWGLPNVTRVDSLANAPYVFADEDAIAVESALEYAVSEGTEKAANPLRSNLNLNRYVSQSGRVAAVVVTCDVPVGTERDVKEISRAAMRLAEQYEQVNPDLRVYVTGEVPLMETFGRAALEDSALLLPVSLAVVFAIVAFFLRDGRLVSALLLNAIMAVVVSLSVFTLRGELLNSATSLIPLVVIVVLSASSLHLLLAVKSGLRHGIEPNVTIELALRRNAIPIIVAAGTTALGFLLLNAADAPPFRSLGTHVAIGVIVGTIGLLLWVPAALRVSRFKYRSNPQTGRVPSPQLSSIDRQLQRPLALAILWCCVGIGLVGLIQLTVDDNFIEYFDQRYEIRQASDFAAKHMAGPNYIDIQVTAKQGSSIYAPEYQKVLADFSQWLRQRELVANVVSVADVMSEVHRAFNDETSLEDLTSDEVAQYLLTFELSLGAGQDLTDYIDIQRKSTRVNALLRGGSSQDIIALENAAYDWFAKRGTNYEVLVTGINVPTAHMSMVNIQGMLTGLLGTICLVVITIWGYFRSLALALVGLLALVLPILVGFGMWGWAAGSIGMAAAAVAAVTLGVVVDDAVHLLFRYRRIRQDERFDAGEAMARARATVGPAITVSSIALVAGFSLLILSGFAVNNTLGLCTALVLACAYFIDLYLLPPLVVALDRSFRILG